MLKYGIWREIRAQVVGCAAAAAVLIFYSYQYFNRINILILSIFYSYPSNYF
jgi:glycerol uptake facilitator-like aquaporin